MKDLYQQFLVGNDEWMAMIWKHIKGIRNVPLPLQLKSFSSYSWKSPSPPLSEVIDQNNNGSGGECNCHLTSTRLTIIPPQKNTTFVIQENWNQIGNELMEGVRLLHPFGRLGSRRHRAWEKNWPHGTGLHNVKNRSYLRHYATLHGTLQCSPGCKGGSHKLKQRMWKCASNESSRGLRIQYI